MSHFVRMFKPQFADKVASGRKIQTVRPTPARMPKPGDTISLRKWEGAPYRSKQVVLRNSIINAVSSVEIGHGGVYIEGRGMWSDGFAKADGFKDFPEMLRWFEEQHGLPFKGILIEWQPKKEPAP